jgi:predicted deacylase
MLYLFDTLPKVMFKIKLYLFAGHEPANLGVAFIYFIFNHFKGELKMKESITFGGITVEPGAKKSGLAKVLDTDYSFPITVINGAKEGKTLLLTAGIHGGEYPCIETAFELAEELNPAELSGQVVIIHPVNIEAYFARISYILPSDQKNINRLFPGDKNGSIGDKIAYVITYEYQMKSDFYIDMHGGDIHETLPPYVYNPGIGDNKECLAYAEEAAKHVLSAKYRVRSVATTGAYNSCAILGVPSLLLEQGGRGLWSKKEVNVYKADIINIMKFLKIYPGEAKLPEKPAKLITKAEYLDSTCSGRWYPMAGLEEKVKAGQVIGIIKDIFGKTLCEVKAKYDSIILFETVSLAINEGDPIITYGI